jgi:uncharacterized protein YraI
MNRFLITAALALTPALASAQTFVPVATVAPTSEPAPIVVAAATAVPATSIADLNLRTMPTNYGEVITIMPRASTVQVEACNLDGWCQVNFNGIEGYAYGDYLYADSGASPVYLTSEVVQTGYVPAFTYEYPSDYVAPSYRIVSAAPTYYETYKPSTADQYVIDYVAANPVETVYLNGEVVPGAFLPREVALHMIPGNTYLYANINGYSVVVDPVDGRIVLLV